MARICVTDAIPGPSIDRLRATGNEILVWDGAQPPGRAELLDLVRGADAVLTVLSDGVDDEFLDAAGPG